MGRSGAMPKVSLIVPTILSSAADFEMRNFLASLEVAARTLKLITATAGTGSHVVGRGAQLAPSTIECDSVLPMTYLKSVSFRATSASCRA